MRREKERGRRKRKERNRERKRLIKEGIEEECGKREEKGRKGR